VNYFIDKLTDDCLDLDFSCFYQQACARKIILEQIDVVELNINLIIRNTTSFFLDCLFIEQFMEMILSILSVQFHISCEIRIENTFLL
jgi:hypothetical protein